jgi:hypothetical protein
MGLDWRGKERFSSAAQLSEGNGVDSTGKDRREMDLSGEERTGE